MDATSFRWASLSGFTLLGFLRAATNFDNGTLTLDCVAFIAILLMPRRLTLARTDRTSACLSTEVGCWALARPRPRIQSPRREARLSQLSPAPRCPAGTIPHWF